ncbi:class I SAM-dependent methyltransferase [Kordiimonas sp.]|uniref:class I SAM-dependent methyltransferase n=1 Tax=Kordiimonas sp. TaxID=1970157 RepID=UPI003A8DAB5C
MSQTKKTILIFPFGPPASISHAKACENMGYQVIGASSLTLEPTRKLADHWVQLPFFNAPNFETELLQCLLTFDVDEIYCCHPVVYGRLAEISSNHHLHATLKSNSGWQEEFTNFRTAETLADLYHSAKGIPPLPHPHLASIYYQTLTIPGWCSTEKIAAFIDIFNSVPRGDIVEIGVWCGKSATALAMLAKHFGQGKLLCIDPWANINTFQKEDGGVNGAMLNFDMDEVWRHFTCSMLSLVPNHVNYIRATSAKAHAFYEKGASLKTAEFGKTSYMGEIALLHIDGNHDQDIVTQDLNKWCPHLVANGWLVIDDYVHAWGQGPRIVGDAFLTKYSGEIVRSFVSGSALFIQLGSTVTPQF